MKYRDTSLEAWRSFAPHSPTLDQTILAVIAANGNATCEEITLASGRLHQAVSGNLRHLVERGKLRDSGERRPTTSGRSAAVWEAVGP